jgi:hypothetical protein
VARAQNAFAYKRRAEKSPYCAIDLLPLPLVPQLLEQQTTRPCPGPGRALRMGLTRDGDQATTDSTHSISLLFGRAPILVAATWPFLNSISVGMPLTP